MVAMLVLLSVLSLAILTGCNQNTQGETVRKQTLSVGVVYDPCDEDGDGNSTTLGDFSKEMDGQYIPWGIEQMSFDDSSKSKNGEDDSERGKGKIFNDDGVHGKDGPGSIWNNASDHEDGDEEWAITARWEYVHYRTIAGLQPGNRSGYDEGVELNAAKDDIVAKSGPGDSSWYTDAKIVVVDTENNKAAVCVVNDWGGGPVGILAGLNEKNIGEESELIKYFGGMSRVSSGFEGELYFAPKDTPVGPVSLDGSGSSGSSSGNSGSGETVGDVTWDDNAKKVAKRFQDEGFSKAATAGVLGNLNQESHFNPEAVNSSSNATGIAQWLGGRLDALKSFASGKGKSHTDLDVQIDYLIKEAKDSGSWLVATWKSDFSEKYPNMGHDGASLRDGWATASSVEDAAFIWYGAFERGGKSEVGGRMKFAEQYGPLLDGMGGDWAEDGTAPDMGGSSGGDSSSSSSSAAGSKSVEKVMAYAKAQVGKPYVWGAAGPDSFDCSGLTMMSYSQVDISLTHKAQAQYDYIKGLDRLVTDISQCKEGDLLFWSSSGSESNITHVGLYEGNNRIVHAANPSKGVCEQEFYSDGFMGGGSPEELGTGSSDEDKEKDESCDSESDDGGGFDDDELYFYQSDYKGQEYADGFDIASHGCGLCSATCAIDLLLGKKYEPPEVAEKLRATGITGICIDRGTQYQQWKEAIQKAFPIKINGVSSVDEATKELQSKHCLVVGNGGDTFIKDDGSTAHHEGHVIMFYKYDGTYYYAKDSAEKPGASIKYTKAQFEAHLATPLGDGRVFTFSKS